MRLSAPTPSPPPKGPRDRRATPRPPPRGVFRARRPPRGQTARRSVRFLRRDPHRPSKVDVRPGRVSRNVSGRRRARGGRDGDEPGADRVTSRGSQHVERTPVGDDERRANVHQKGRRRRAAPGRAPSFDRHRESRDGVRAGGVSLRGSRTELHERFFGFRRARVRVEIARGERDGAHARARDFTGVVERDEFESERLSRVGGEYPRGFARRRDPARGDRPRATVRDDVRARARKRRLNRDWRARDETPRAAVAERIRGARGGNLVVGFRHHDDERRRTVGRRVRARREPRPARVGGADSTDGDGPVRGRDAEEDAAGAPDGVRGPSRFRFVVVAAAADSHVEDEVRVAPRGRRAAPERERRGDIALDGDCAPRRDGVGRARGVGTRFRRDGRAGSNPTSPSRPRESFFRDPRGGASASPNSPRTPIHPRPRPRRGPRTNSRSRSNPRGGFDPGNASSNPRRGGSLESRVKNSSSWPRALATRRRGRNAQTRTPRPRAPIPHRTRTRTRTTDRIASTVSPRSRRGGATRASRAREASRRGDRRRRGRGAGPTPIAAAAAAPTNEPPRVPKDRSDRAR